MRKAIAISAVWLATLGLGAVAASSAQAASKWSEFKEICEVAGGTAHRDWGRGTYSCRFADGSGIKCTATLRTCWIIKAPKALLPDPGGDSRPGIGTTPGQAVAPSAALPGIGTSPGQARRAVAGIGTSPGPAARRRGVRTG